MFAKQDKADMKIRILGVLASFLFVGPIAFLAWFILSHAHETRDTNWPNLIAISIVLVGIIYSGLHPAEFIRAAKIAGQVFNF